MISYYGHSSLSGRETEQRLQTVRASFARETWQALRLSAAQPLTGPFDREIARSFGIEAQSQFTLSMLDKQLAHHHAPRVVDRLYAVFEAGTLVMTWELDSIIAPSTPVTPRST